METTLVLVKPDAVRRALVAEIVGRFERRGFALRGMRLMQLDRATAEHHYAEHAEKPFFGELVGFITSGPIVALALAGEGAIQVVRDMMGATHPQRSGLRFIIALGLVREQMAHGVPPVRL